MLSQYYRPRQAQTNHDHIIGLSSLIQTHQVLGREFSIVTENIPSIRAWK